MINRELIQLLRKNDNVVELVQVEATKIKETVDKIVEILREKKEE